MQGAFLRDYIPCAHFNHTIYFLAAVNWGIDIKRYEITEVMPDQHIIDAMDKQAAAERERRKTILEAEGTKRQLELESEGRKIQLRNESEGELIRQRNMAQARKEQFSLEAEGEAYAIQKKAEAHATAIAAVAAALEGQGAGEAAKLNMAREVSVRESLATLCAWRVDNICTSLSLTYLAPSVIPFSCHSMSLCTVTLGRRAIPCSSLTSLRM